MKQAASQNPILLRAQVSRPRGRRSVCCSRRRAGEECPRAAQGGHRAEIRKAAVKGAMAALTVARFVSTMGIHSLAARVRCANESRGWGESSKKIAFPACSGLPDTICGASGPSKGDTLGKVTPSAGGAAGSSEVRVGTPRESRRRGGSGHPVSQPTPQSPDSLTKGYPLASARE
jgi:hypothetical protein